MIESCDSHMEHSGHFWRAFLLQTVHFRSPNAFLIPFLLPSHQRHMMNPCPPHTLHTVFVEVCGGCGVCVGGGGEGGVDVCI